MYERFTDRARRVMQLANQEAQRFAHSHIGTEHFLLGLCKEGSGVAANVLKNLNIDLRSIRLEVEKIIQPAPSDEQVIMGRLPHTPRATRAIENAIAQAAELAHNYVGTEHVLLGILCVKEGVAAQVLLNLGVSLESVRAAVLVLLPPKGIAPPDPSQEPWMTYLAVRGAKPTGSTTLKEMQAGLTTSHTYADHVQLRDLRDHLRAAITCLDTILTPPPAADTPTIVSPPSE